MEIKQGCCIFCGAIKMIELPKETSQEIVDQEVTNECMCSRAVMLRERIRQKEACICNIEELLEPEHTEIAEMFKEAEAIMKSIREKVQLSLNFEVPDVIARGVNPSQHQKFKTIIPVLERVNEDLRGIKYGADCFEILALFTKYYEELYHKQDTTYTWNRIYELANKMSEYTFAYKYSNQQVEITCKDALDRSGVKELFARVLCARNKAKL